MKDFISIAADIFNMTPEWLKPIYLFLVVIIVIALLGFKYLQRNFKKISASIGVIGNKITDLEHGVHIDNTDAYKQAISTIMNKIEDSGDSKISFDVKFTVVGMKYSYTHVLEPLFKLLKENENISISLQILLVCPKYLINTIKENSDLKNWAVQSSGIITRCVNLIETLSESCQKRLNIEIRTYTSIPQYHGIIIDDEHLFLGRTDWQISKDLDPKRIVLTVGENKYRYFNSTPTNSNVTKERYRERVDLFLNWHKFYWHFFSEEPVLHYLNCNWMKLPLCS